MKTSYSGIDLTNIHTQGISNVLNTSDKDKLTAAYYAIALYKIKHGDFENHGNYESLEFKGSVKSFISRIREIAVIDVPQLEAIIISVARWNSNDTVARTKDKNLKICFNDTLGIYDYFSEDLIKSVNDEIETFNKIMLHLPYFDK